MLTALLDSVAASVDRAVLRAQKAGGPDGEIARMSQAERLERLHALAAAYGDPALLEGPAAFLQAPAPIEPTLRPVTGRVVVDARWPSAYTPWNVEIAERYGAFVENRTVHARLFLGERPGPTVILVHGYGAGHIGLEERFWPIRELRRQGWDVVLANLPFHGRRAPPGRGLNPPFPATDPRLANEGFRQAIHELRALHAWLVARGHGLVGAWGMSLGGYTAALLATVEPSLAFAGLVIPLGSPADYARLHGRLGEGPEADALHAALERVNAVVSPYTRPAALAPDRVRVVATRSDRITGVPQATRLARHFGVAPTVWPGGHILQVGIRGAYASLLQWLGDGGRFRA